MIPQAHMYFMYLSSYYIYIVCMVRRHGGIGLLFYVILVATGYVSPLLYLVSKMTPVGVLTVEINYLVRGVIRLSSDVFLLQHR